ncbi:MAG: aldose 1-epimerase, partial [Aureibaculum sp.]
MLQIKKITNQNDLLDHIYIYNKHISCKIFPNLGASIQEFIIKGISIIDGVTIDQNGIDAYFNTHKSAILFPFPNRVKDGNYDFGGSNYQLKINEPKKHNAIHGMLFDKHFKIVDQAVNAEEASVSLSYTSNGTLEGYPFKFVFIVKYTIKPEGVLSLSFHVKNTDKIAFPFGIGWHPYFKSNNLDDSTLTFASKEHFIFNERSIPDTIKISEMPFTFSINNHTYDDGFSLINASLIYKDSKYIL